MIHYKELYLKMFVAAADALDAINDMNFGRAKEILLRAQLEAEEKHMDEQPAREACGFLETIK